MRLFLELKPPPSFQYYGLRVLPGVERWMDGSLTSLTKSDSVYNRKHFPGLVRPARPARCAADALEMGVTSRDSTRIRGLYTFCFENPGSTT
jgi:hypothetical protein